MNQLHEWILLFLSSREQSGQSTSARDLFAASTSATHLEVMELMDLGLIALEKPRSLPSLQKDLGANTIIVLTDKGKMRFQKPDPARAESR